MEYETYADVIDAYNADNMGYSTLTDYIKGQNIKIKDKVISVCVSKILKNPGRFSVNIDARSKRLLVIRTGIGTAYNSTTTFFVYFTCYINIIRNKQIGEKTNVN